jgi:hypothetical protein
MRLAALVLAAAVVAAAPALAQTDPTAPPPPAPAASTEAGAEGTPPAGDQAEQPAEEEQICRTVQRTESRLRNRRERICGTRAQWEQMQEQNARDLNRRGSVQNVPRN